MDNGVKIVKCSSPPTSGTGIHFLPHDPADDIVYEIRNRFELWATRVMVELGELPQSWLVVRDVRTLEPIAQGQTLTFPWDTDDGPKL